MPPKAKKMVPVVQAKNRIILYIRVSTEVQELSGLSQQDQETILRKFVELKGLIIHEIISEVISGSVKARERSGLKRGLAMLEKGLAHGIAVTKLDRLGRGAADTIALIDHFNEMGYSFYSVQENIDCTTVIGQAMIGLMSVFANLERNMIRARTQTVMDGKKSRGELCGRCPFGMQATPNSKGVKMLVPHPEEMETIRLAKKLRAQTITRKLRNSKEKKAPMTYRAICEELIRLGRKNREGEVKWYPSQVMGLVKTEVDERYGDTEPSTEDDGEEKEDESSEQGDEENEEDSEEEITE
jgi:site-specific DNA recombinase